jgi:hypothetical protein
MYVCLQDLSIVDYRLPRGILKVPACQDGLEFATVRETRSSHLAEKAKVDQMLLDGR